MEPCDELNSEWNETCVEGNHLWDEGNPEGEIIMFVE
jgi:hypothetical protein